MSVHRIHTRGTHGNRVALCVGGAHRLALLRRGWDRWPSPAGVREAQVDDLQCEVVRPLPLLIKDLLLLAVLIKVEVAVDDSLDTRNGAWEVGQQVCQLP
jgi:hypothetical protein